MNTTTRKSTAIWDLIGAVQHAIEQYDTSDDHRRHEPGADCIRCKLAMALPHYVGDPRGPETKPEGYRWKLILKVRRGHRFYFEENSGRYALADDSGRNPEECDDGILWIDHSCPLKVAAADKNGDDLRCYVPLIVERDQSKSRTFDPVEATGAIAVALKMKVTAPPWLSSLTQVLRTDEG
jgi:hypothetical protein